MNITSKSTAGLGRLPAAAVQRDDISFVIDPMAGQIRSATAMGCRIWGLPLTETTFPVPLDRSMPALATLRSLIARKRSPISLPATIPLYFWTARGIRQWVCRVSLLGQSRQDARQLLVVPDLTSVSAFDVPERDRLSFLAHEVRTPLASIQAYADLLLETRLGPTSDARTRAYVASIAQAARHGLGVVTSLLSRPSVLPEPTTNAGHASSLGEVMADVLETMRPLVIKAGARIDVPPLMQLPVVVADRLAVTQVLLNLLTNALRHAGPSPRIRIRCGGGAGAWIEVGDNGPGFPDALLHHATPNVGGDVQARLVASASGPVSGIGLALSSALAAGCGARLVLSNGPKGGARARLVFDDTRQAAPIAV